MLIEAHHKIEERGDHRMVLRHFSKGHAYIVADRQHASGKWTVSAVRANVARKTKDIIVDARGEALDAMQDMALEVLSHDDQDGPMIGRPYTVQEGDTLFSIATQFHMSLQTLKTANPGVNDITAGQVIIAPGYACLIPYHKELADGTKIKLHDKP